MSMTGTGLTLRLKVEMVKTGVKQQDIADALGLPQSAVSARFTGKTEWRVVELLTVASLLGVTPSELLDAA